MKGKIFRSFSSDRLVRYVARNRSTGMVTLADMRLTGNWFEVSSETFQREYSEVPSTLQSATVTDERGYTAATVAYAMPTQSSVPTQTNERVPIRVSVRGNHKHYDFGYASVAR